MVQGTEIGSMEEDMSGGAGHRDRLYGGRCVWWCRAQR